MKRYLIGSIVIVGLVGIGTLLAVRVVSPVPRPEMHEGPSTASSSPSAVAASSGLSALVPSSSPAFAATSTPASCQAAKLKATGRLLNSLLYCNAGGADSGDQPDAACVQSSTDHFAAAFAQAESSGACLTTGDASSTETQVNTLVASIVATLRPTNQASACTAAKLRAIGKLAAKLFGAYAADRIHPNGSRLAKHLISTKATTTKAFARAETLGDCLTTGDLQAATTEIEAGVTRIVAPLFPWPTTAIADVSLTVPLPAESVGQPRAASTTGTALSGYEIIHVPVTNPSGTAPDAFTVLVDANPSGLSLTDWFAQNIDTTGILAPAGTYSFYSFADGRTALVLENPVPPDYDQPGFLPPAFVMAADRSKVASLSFTTENSLPTLGYSDRSAMLLLLKSFIVTLVL